MNLINVLFSLAVATQISVAPIGPELPPEPPPIIETTPIVEEEELIVGENTLCSCVSYLRSLGVELPRGDAEDLEIGDTPHIGGVIKLKYKVYHIALIVGFNEEGFEVIEANYKPCEKTSRIIPYDDDRIVGFWYNK